MSRSAVILGTVSFAIVASSLAIQDYRGRSRLVNPDRITALYGRDSEQTPDMQRWGSGLYWCVDKDGISASPHKGPCKRTKDQVTATKPYQELFDRLNQQVQQ